MTVTVPTRSGRELVHSQDPARGWVTAIMLGGFFCAVWPCLLSLTTPAPVNATVLTAHVAGMLAGYGVVVLIALMARIPVLERQVGADRLARWHSRGGRTVVALVVIHAYAATLAWAQGRRQSLPVAVWHVLGLPGLAAATVGTVLLVAVAALSIRAARRRVSFETWHGVHLLV